MPAPTTTRPRLGISLLPTIERWLRSTPVRRLLVTGTIAVLVAYAFAPTRRGEWLWHDDEAITANPLLEDPAGWWRPWISVTQPIYRPLVASFQWLQWRWFGSATTGYHLVSIGCHFLVALLVARVLRRLGVRHAWLGGLAFAVHPLVVESVAWISFQHVPMALLLLLLATDAWISFDATLRTRHHALAIAWFTLALFCGPAGVTWPAVLLLFAWWRRGAIGRSDWAAIAPLVGIAAAFGLVNVWLQQARIGESMADAGGWLHRIANTGAILGFYAKKFLMPADLAAAYAPWTVQLTRPGVWLPWLVFAATVGVAWKLRHRWGRHLIFGVGTFVLLLLPAAGLVNTPWNRYAWVADHFAYMPIVALIGLAVATLGLCTPRLPARGRRYLLAAVCIPVVLSARTSREHGQDFRDSIALWTTTTARQPGSGVAHYNLGVALEKAHRLPDATRAFEEALRLNPDSVAASFRLACTHDDAGRIDAAIAAYEDTLRNEPAHRDARRRLAALLHRSGRSLEALLHYEVAVHTDPDDASSRFEFGLVLLARQRITEAAAEVDEALRLAPDHARAFRAAREFAAAGRNDHAIRYLDACVHINPSFAPARAMLEDLQRNQPLTTTRP